MFESYYIAEHRKVFLDEAGNRFPDLEEDFFVIVCAKDNIILEPTYPKLSLAIAALSRLLEC